MRDIWDDIRYAVRVLLQRLPFDRSDRIVALGMRDPRPRNFGVSSQDFDDWRRTTRTIPDLSAAFGANLSFSGDDRAPEQYTGVYMSATGFPIIGSKPVIGRLYTADDDRAGAPAVVVISNDIWQNRYGRDPSVLC